MSTKKNYPPIICNRCNDTRRDLTKCSQKDCDFEGYRDAIWDYFRGSPPPKYYCALTGGVNAGKTFYLLALIHALTKDFVSKQELQRHGIKSIVMIDPVSKRYYNEFLNDCKNGRLSITLPTAPLSFFSLFVNTNNGTFEIVLFNTSGEKIEDASYDEDYRTEAHELKGASTIHFVDPFEDTKLSNLLNIRRDSTFWECKNIAIIEYILMVMKFMNNSSSVVSNPTAICISKFDLLLHHIPMKISENPYANISSNDFFDEITLKSHMLKTFLENHSTTVSPSRIYESFSNLNYFAVAPFGSSSTPAYWRNRESKGILPPFLWILKELKIISG